MVNALISIVSAILGLLGLLFVIGWQHQAARLVIGGVLVSAGILMFATMRLAEANNDRAKRSI